MHKDVYTCTLRKPDIIHLFMDDLVMLNVILCLDKNQIYMYMYKNWNLSVPNALNHQMEVVLSLSPGFLEAL